MKRYIAFVSLLAGLSLSGVAQEIGAPDLRSLARDAGIIFSGTVQKIEPVNSAIPGDIGRIRITFKVSDSLRGATTGQTLTINEWDGLWTSSDRYRVGENLLLFLYPPSGELGLTTTVAGARGRIPLADSALSMAEIEGLITADLTTEPDHLKPKPSRPERARVRMQVAE